MERPKVKLSIVRLGSKDGRCKTYIVKHLESVDPVDVFVNLIDKAPEMKMEDDAQAQKLYIGATATYPRRKADWEESKRICEEYEKELSKYDADLVELDERKMSGQVTNAEELNLPQRPSPEHYPLPPEPEEPEEPQVLPFDGSFRDCVDYIQSSHLEQHGIVSLMVEDDVEVYNITEQ